MVGAGRALIAVDTGSQPGEDSGCLSQNPQHAFRNTPGSSSLAIAHAFRIKKSEVRERVHCLISVVQK